LSTRLIVAVLLTALAAGCHAPAPRPPPAAAPKTVSSAKAEGIQCRTERLTGSLLPTRICTTKAQRDQQDANARAFRDAVNNENNPVCTTGPYCGSK
jgi:hypothetical protein